MPDVAPFGSGIQFLLWQNANCCKCRKYGYDPATETERVDCDILRALYDGMITGVVPVETAKRMGTTQCKEKEAAQ